jgi:putative oxidoreductase
MSDGDMVAWGALLLRVALGVLFLAHGWMKLTVFKPAGTAQFFQSIGLPGALAYVVIFAELAGGVLLVFGVGTRVVALLMIPILVGTIVTVHGAKGWGFSNPGGGWEYPAFWTVTLIVQALIGSGAYALYPIWG